MRTHKCSLIKLSKRGGKPSDYCLLEVNRNYSSNSINASNNKMCSSVMMEQCCPLVTIYEYFLVLLHFSIFLLLHVMLLFIVNQ